MFTTIVIKANEARVAVRKKNHYFELSRAISFSPTLFLNTNAENCQQPVASCY